MTRDEMRTFVHDLTEDIKNDILRSIDSGRIPEDWNGHELRRLLADKFDASATTLSPRQMRAYNNTRLVANI